MRKLSYILISILLIVFLAGCSEEDESTVAHVPQLSDVATMSSMLRNARRSAEGVMNVEVTYSGDSVILSWDDIAASYTVERTDMTGATVQLRCAGASLTEKASSLDGIYTYTVSGYSSSGETESSDSVTVYAGFVVEDGVLNCYRDGSKVRNCDIGSLHFDENGAYTSGDPQFDEKVTSLIAEMTDSSMTRLEMFRVMYDYIMDNSDYESIRFAEKETGWELEYAKDFLETGLGNCFSYAGLTAMMARALGFEARGIYGSVNQTFEWCDHGWTEVDYNGKTYVCDSEMEGVFSRTRDFGWDLFMKEYGDTVTKYKKWEW